MRTRIHWFEIALLGTRLLTRTATLSDVFGDTDHMIYVFLCCHSLLPSLYVYFLFCLPWLYAVVELFIKILLMERGGTPPVFTQKKKEKRSVNAITNICWNNFRIRKRWIYLWFIRRDYNNLIHIYSWSIGNF